MAKLTQNQYVGLKKDMTRLPAGSTYTTTDPGSEEVWIYNTNGAPMLVAKGQNSINNIDESATTIDWNVVSFYNTTLTADTTLTFKDPHAPGTFMLKLVQDSTGSRLVTFPANVKWIADTAPTLTTTATTGTDIITFYFDGENYFGVEALNFV